MSSTTTVSTKQHPEDSGFKETLRGWLYFAVVFCATLIIIPIFLPVSVLLITYRHLLVRLIRKIMGEDVMIASGQDAVWLQDSPNNKAIINSILIIKGQPDITKYWELMMNRMVSRRDPDNTCQLLFPKLSMYATRFLRRYIWVREEKFDIKDHVYFYDKLVPKSKTELEEVTGYIFSQGLPDKKAPWEMVIIPPVEGQDEFVLALRFHHCMGDGISLTKAFVHCATDNPPQELTSRKKGFTSTGKALKVAQAVFQGPGVVLNQLMKPMDGNFLHGPAPVGCKRAAWSPQISLTLLKRMTVATGTTVNDVLLSCLAGALAEYSKKHSPNPLNSISASVPVDIRTSKRLCMDNKFAIVFLDLPLDEDDPLTLLARTKKRMDQMKASPEPLVNHLVIAFLMAQLPNVLSRYIINWLSDKCSIVLSNIPGPTGIMKVNDQLIDDLIFWPPQRMNVGKLTQKLFKNQCMLLVVL